MSPRRFVLRSALSALGVILASAVVAQPSVAPQARARTAGSMPFSVGQTVEVDVGGVWHKASIVGIRDGRYALSRHDRSHGVTTREEWVGADRLRPFVAKPAAVAAIAGLPQAVPQGLYSCVTFGTVSATVGKLRIASSTSSSAVTPDGSGAQHRYSYDAATGVIAWVGGMKISGWTVESALYRPGTGGRPNINLHYRLREGGNLNSMSCQRE